MFESYAFKIVVFELIENWLSGYKFNTYLI